MDRGDRAVVILAGGEATRLPGKLELDAGGVPLLLRVYRNLAAVGPVYIAASRSFSRDLDNRLDCPVIVDRWVRRGPLGGLASAFAIVPQPVVFVAAGDAPFVDEAAARELLAAWEPGIEAVVPVNAAGILEPLCAVYDRAAFLAAALPLLRAGSGGVAAAVEHLHLKRVRLSNERAFANVNTTADLQSILRS